LLLSLGEPRQKERAKRSRVVLAATTVPDRLGVKNHSWRHIHSCHDWKCRRCIDSHMAKITLTLSIDFGPWRRKPHECVLFRPWWRKVRNKELVEQTCNEEAACLQWTAAESFDRGSAGSLITVAVPIYASVSDGRNAGESLSGIWLDQNDPFHAIHPVYSLPREIYKERERP
jgi:hypothetical protein